MNERGIYIVLYCVLLYTHYLHVKKRDRKSWKNLFIRSLNNCHDGIPQVVASFVEDMNEVDSRMCAVYSDLTNTLTPHSCDSKYEWICKVPRGLCFGCMDITYNEKLITNLQKRPA